MGSQYLGEVKMFGFGYAPKGWAQCNGQLMPINQNQALFSILGTTYGGDGRTNFALPNLQGRVPVSMGPGFAIGATGGEAAHTLSTQEMPTHTHTPLAGAAASNHLPAGLLPGSNTTQNFYAAASNTNMNLASVQPVGQNQAHNNMSPSLVVNYCIALTGIYPSRN
jgi:microcystin-dependent protein